jgi:hypothetical protein
MFVAKSNRPDSEWVVLAAVSALDAIDEAATLLPTNPDAWTRIDDKWLGAGWPGLNVPAAWNVTLAPHGTHQLWIEQL